MLISHGAGPENVQMMSNLLTEDVFSISAQASIPEHINTQSFVYQNQAGLNVSNIPSHATSVKITDQLGRLILSQNILGASELVLACEHEGIIFISLINQAGTELETIKYICR
jgi:hypothetical protein